MDKGRYRLPPAEKERTDSILKRSLAVEKGEVTSPSLTEEHPDGSKSDRIPSPKLTNFSSLNSRRVALQRRKSVEEEKINQTQSFLSSACQILRLQYVKITRPAKSSQSGKSG